MCEGQPAHKGAVGAKLLAHGVVAAEHEQQLPSAWVSARAERLSNDGPEGGLGGGRDRAACVPEARGGRRPLHLGPAHTAMLRWQPHEQTIFLGFLTTLGNLRQAKISCMQAASDIEGEASSPNCAGDMQGHGENLRQGSAGSN